MPVHGSTPDEVLERFTRAGGSWWLGMTTTRPRAEDTTVDLAAIDLLEVPRTAASWADAADGVVQHATGLDLPPANEDTVVAAWVLFDDPDGLVPRVSRWIDPSQVVSAGTVLHLGPDDLELEFPDVSNPYAP